MKFNKFTDQFETIDFISSTDWCMVYKYLTIYADLWFYYLYWSIL